MSELQVVQRDKMGMKKSYPLWIAQCGIMLRDGRSCYIAIVISHNHPSGDPTPSPEDIAVTEQLVAASQVLDIELVDHLVIGRHRFVSLKERMRW